MLPLFEIFNVIILELFHVLNKSLSFGVLALTIEQSCLGIELDLL